MAISKTKIGLASMIGSVIISVSTPVMANDHYQDRYYQNESRDYYYDRGQYRDYRQDRRYYDDRRDRTRRCDNGTGGTIIGAIAGGLLGNEIVGRRGDKTAGLIIGAGVGALAGRAIDRSDGRRC